MIWKKRRKRFGIIFKKATSPGTLSPQKYRAYQKYSYRITCAIILYGMGATEISSNTPDSGVPYAGMSGELVHSKWSMDVTRYDIEAQDGSVSEVLGIHFPNKATLGLIVKN